MTANEEPSTFVEDSIDIDSSDKPIETIRQTSETSTHAGGGKQQEEIDSQAQNKTPLIIGLVCLAIVLVAIIVGVVLLRDKFWSKNKKASNEIDFEQQSVSQETAIYGKSSFSNL